MILFLLFLTCAQAYLLDDIPWSDVQAQVFKKEIDWDNGWTLADYISYQHDSVDENTLLSNVKFLIENGGYQIEPEYGDIALGEACWYSLKVAELLLQYPRVGREAANQIDRNPGPYTRSLSNPNRNYDELLRFWKLLIANEVSESSFYYFLSPFAMKLFTTDQTLELLNLAYQNEHIIKPTERRFYPELDPEFETFNRWMVAHNVTMRNFDMRYYKTPEALATLVSQLTDLGFDIHTVINWVDLLHDTIRDKNFNMAKHLLSTYLDHLGRVSGDNLYFDMFVSIPESEVREYSNFFIEYILPLMRKEYILPLMRKQYSKSYLYTGPTKAYTMMPNIT